MENKTIIAAMYTGVQDYAVRHGMEQTQLALPLMRRYHEGQFRKGKEKLPYIIHPLTIACHCIALGLAEDEMLAAILLHDVCEDCPVSPGELPVSETVRRTVELLTFCVMPQESRPQAKERYFAEIAKNRNALLIKVLDRCNNISGMASGFADVKLASYIKETELYVLPLLDRLAESAPQWSAAVFLLRYQMNSILESVACLL